MRLNVAVYAVFWNEAAMLPFFLRHYAAFARTLNLYDNESTDRSLDIIDAFRQSHPDVTINVRTFDSGDRLRDDYIINKKNHAWKECAGRPVDWVVIVDVDEFIHHPNLPAELQRLRREEYTAVFCVGYDMVADEGPRAEEPVPLTSLVRRGRFSENYSKCTVIDPNAVTSINYTVGSHACTPKGRVKIHADNAFKLRHYKALGLDNRILRRRQIRARLSEVNRHNDWGYHNDFEESVHREWFATLDREATEVV